MQQNNLTISNILILISIFFTFLVKNYVSTYELGMNTDFLNNGEYFKYLRQFFTYNFTHGDIMHILGNSVFIYIFGNMLEQIITKKRFLIFFIFITIFNGIGLSIFEGNVTTIGISGFVLAILTYYTLELKSLKNPEYKGGITAIILNIGIGFHPEISLLGHLFGAIGGAIFYYINKDFFFKQKVGLFTKIKEIFIEPKVPQPENIKKL